LIRSAALSVGLSVNGAWRGDTLRGRAHGFSDVVSPSTDPRANAYGIRYDCGARAAADAAGRTLHDLLASDRADSLRNAREDSLERARWDRILRRPPN
jgi:hypothetical protein